jgi:CBS domain containing-hemolysin-like protein
VGGWQLLFRLLIVAALILINAFFVAVEFSLVAARRTRIEQLAGEGNRSASQALELLKDPDRFIAAAQLGITMASLALG